MDSTTIRRGVDVAWCLVALGAMWTLTRTLPGVGAQTPFVLVVALSIVLLAIADRERSLVVLGVPALMIVLLLVSGERDRLFASGIVLTACLVTSGWRWTAEGRMALSRAIVLLGAALTPAMVLPLNGDGVGAAVVAGVGAIAIVLASSDAERVGVDAVIIAYCAALAAPAVPARASLFTFVVAAMILLLRRPGSFTAGAFVLLVLAAGKWYLPLVIAIAAGFALHRYRSTGKSGEAKNTAIALPLVSSSPAAAVSALSLAPDVWARARHSSVATAMTALFLAAGSLVVQPSLATIYVVAAVACLVGAGSGERWSPVMLSFAVVMSGLTAWSGSISGAFPLPVSLGVVVLLAIAAWVGGIARDEESRSFNHVAGAAGAGLAVMLVLIHPALGSKYVAIASGLRIAPGDSVSVPLPSGVSALRIKIAGGNVAGLEGATVAGIIRVEPGGVVRELRIGDFADWGVRRKAHFLSAENPRALEPAGPVLGEGREAFLSGSGVVRLETIGATSLTIEASDAIGEAGRLLIDSVEVEK